MECQNGEKNFPLIGNCAVRTWKNVASARLAHRFPLVLRGSPVAHLQLDRRMYTEKDRRYPLACKPHAPGFVPVTGILSLVSEHLRKSTMAYLSISVLLCES
jgi:hypothetical protein